MAQRQYEAATVFNARIVDMRHLWEPSREFKGQPTTKPNHFATFIVPKTNAQWFNEPALAGVAQACSKFTGIMQMYNYNQNSVIWPIADGDMPSPEGKTSDFAKGHWLFTGSSGNQPNTELAQAGGVLVKLSNRTGVKPGDYCMAGVTAAIAQNMANRIKLYLNAVVFSAPGEEIVFANSVSGAELMRMAQQQGLQVAGFAGAPGGFNTNAGFVPNGPGGGGFAPNMAAPGFSQPPGSVQPQHNFAPPNGAGGFAPPPGNPATAFPSNAGQGAPPFGQGQNGTMTFPSNNQFPQR